MSHVSGNTQMQTKTNKPDDLQHHKHYVSLHKQYVGIESGWINLSCVFMGDQSWVFIAFFFSLALQIVDSHMWDHVIRYLTWIDFRRNLHTLKGNLAFKCYWVASYVLNRPIIQMLQNSRKEKCPTPDWAPDKIQSLFGSEWNRPDQPSLSLL